MFILTYYNSINVKNLHRSLLKYFVILVGFCLHRSVMVGNSDIRMLFLCEGLGSAWRRNYLYISKIWRDLGPYYMVSLYWILFMPNFCTLLIWLRRSKTKGKYWSTYSTYFIKKGLLTCFGREKEKYILSKIN